MAFRLLIQDRVFTAAQLLAQPAAAMQTALESTVVHFAQQWLRGEQWFTMHTSGSTGEPKEIKISRQHMQASARLTLQALRLGAADASLLCIHPGFVGGKMMLVRAMEGKFPLRIVEAVANPFLLLSEGFQPHFAALVPLQLQEIIKDAASAAVLDRMKAVIVGGAAVSSQLEEQLQTFKVPVFSTYGMTETVSHVALRRLNGTARQEYFEALPGITLSTDERGCLIIAGPVTDKPVLTNDVVEIQNARRFRWLGRADNTINSGGIKVQAERVELQADACLQAMEIRGRRILAGGLPDEKLGEKVVLLMEGAPVSAGQQKQLLDCLQQNLPLYWAPKEILFIAKFIESENGKIKRKETFSQF